MSGHRYVGSPLHNAGIKIQRRLMRLEDRLEGLEEDNKALTAQVETLREALRSLIDNTEYWIERARPYRPTADQYRTWIALGWQSPSLLEAKAALAETASDGEDV